MIRSTVFDDIPSAFKHVGTDVYNFQYLWLLALPCMVEPAITRWLYPSAFQKLRTKPQLFI
jgi:hypothetical protein